MRRMLPLLLGILLLAGCAKARVTASGEVGTQATLPPAAIYVADFEIDAGEIKEQRGVLDARPLGILPSGPLAELRHGDSRAEARHLVNLMADTLVADLAKAGLAARRVPAGAAPPAQGWLVRGLFLQVDEGNRLRRAVVGFGAGGTQLQVAAAIDQLSAGAPASFYQLDTNAASGKLPGAAVTLNPYVAAVRFVLAGQDLDRNVKETAGEIAKRVAARVNAAGR